MSYSLPLVAWIRFRRIKYSAPLLERASLHVVDHMRLYVCTQRASKEVLGALGELGRALTTCVVHP